MPGLNWGIESRSNTSEEVRDEAAINPTGRTGGSYGGKEEEEVRT
jgi:hypothetical protein